MAVAAVTAALALAPAGAAVAEQASDPASPASGRLDAGSDHTCAVLADGSVRCWGLGSSGQLGYGSTNSVGVDDTPATAGPVDLGAGRTAVAVAAGDYHTCAILDNGQVECWGFGADGRLGYGNTNTVLDPSTAGPVDLGPGTTAKAITAGGSHTCAILGDGSVRCWGFGGNGYSYSDGRLGYGNTNNVLDPSTVGPVNLGPGRNAKAITAGESHTCAILDDGNVRCWGFGAFGQLGYGSNQPVGSTPTTTPDTAGPVDLGQGQTAVAISAGGDHTCAILDNGQVECWGVGSYGELGYGNLANVGDTPTDVPGVVGPVNLGPHRAVAISSGADDSCAILDDGTVRCWGWGEFGRLGYPTLDSLGNQPNVGDKPTTLPASAGPVDLGTGRTAVAISAGDTHTCALLDNGSVRCWGQNNYGQLGYCNTADVGETDTPGSVGPVNLTPGDGGETCPGSGGGSSSPTPTPTPPPTPTPVATPSPAAAAGPPAAALRAQAQRTKQLRRCQTRAARNRHPRRRASARVGCLRRYARTPGPMTGLLAGPLSLTALEVEFPAPGTAGTGPPPARGYMIKISRHPIRTWRDFQRAHTLCGGDCIFDVTNVADLIVLTVTDLKPYTTYYFAIAARDNVTLRCGAHAVVEATTGPPPPDSGPGMHNPPSSPPSLATHPAPPCQRG